MTQFLITPIIFNTKYYLRKIIASILFISSWLALSSTFDILPKSFYLKLKQRDENISKKITAKLIRERRTKVS